MPPGGYEPSMVRRVGMAARVVVVGVSWNEWESERMARGNGTRRRGRGGEEGKTCSFALLRSMRPWVSFVVGGGWWWWWMVVRRCVVVGDGGCGVAVLGGWKD